jgi:nucleotide-binding universal stress UspA family protein
MSTHGADGFMERISGSEAQHVARFLQVPVITLRPGTSVLKLENILFVADFEMFGKGIQINLIKQLAIAFDSTIHLLQILKEEDEPYVDEIEAQMKFFAEEHGIQKYEMHLYRDKKIASGIKNFNQEADMDLVCIRTHGRRGISHLWFGSIAERLVNHCLKPLLTFHLRTYA